VKTLELHKEYLVVPYSLPKLDMFAIPDFAAGATENYGLVTYREIVSLYTKNHYAAANKQRVTTMVAHELAHQIPRVDRTCIFITELYSQNCKFTIT